MKKTLYILFLIVNTLAFSQSGPNRFEESENDNVFNKTNNTEDQTFREGQGMNSLDSGGGNPGDPLPIDNYTAILAITAVGIIIYTARTRKKLLS